MRFVDIPIRAVTRTLPEWWNSLRSAGVNLEGYIGSGFITETNVAVANTQAVATNITGLIIDKTAYKSAKVDYEVRRETASAEVTALGKLTLIYRTVAAAWEVVDESTGDAHGVTFTITSAGQVQYTSDTLAGTGYVGPSSSEQ